MLNEQIFLFVYNFDINLQIPAHQRKYTQLPVKLFRVTISISNINMEGLLT